MHGYRSIVPVLCLIALITSCRSLRPVSSVRYIDDKGFPAREFFRSVSSNNIINGPVAVNRISLHYKDEDQERSFKANLKYNGRDTILVSIRSLAGLEAARMLVTGDSVKIIDRINKILYISDNRSLGNKLGFDIVDFGLLFGDLMNNFTDKRKIICSDGLVYKTDNGKYYNTNYRIRCDVLKVEHIESFDKEGNIIAIGQFDKFRKEDGVNYPGEIEWNLGSIELRAEMQGVVRKERMNYIFNIKEAYEIRVIK